MKALKFLAIAAILVTGCGAPDSLQLSDIRHGGRSSSDDGAGHDQGDDHGGRRGDQSDDSEGGRSGRGEGDRSGREARIVTPATQTFALGASVSLDLERARQRDDDTYIFSATGLPAGLNIDAASGKISGVVGGSAGTFEVTVSFVEANEPVGHRARSISFQIIVTEAQAKPG